MEGFRLAVVAVLCIAVSAPAFPRGSSSGGYSSRSYSSGSVARDSSGRIQRSTTAKNEFKRANPCPSTGAPSGACPGYVIDHVQPLKRGGPDAPSNMQWQTREAAKAKDRWE